MLFVIFLYKPFLSYHPIFFLILVWWNEQNSIIHIMQEQRVCVRKNIIRRNILRGWVAVWTIDTRKKPEWNTASCGENRSIAIFLRQSLHKYIKVISVTGDRGGMCSSSEVYSSLVKKPRPTLVARWCITSERTSESFVDRGFFIKRVRISFKN